MWSKGWNNSGLQAPQGASPFAPAPQGGAAPAGRPDEAATGPMLGKGSELRKLYYMPHNMGHGDAVNCMLMADGKIYTGGRDEYLFVWKPDRAANGEIQLSQDCPPIHLGASITSLFYEPTSKWLFCGLWNGEVRAFCKEPMRDDRLQGHRRSVTALQVHSGVLISGSNEGTVRLWTFNGQSFQPHGQPLTNPSGPVTAVRVLNDALWVGGYEGITCFDLGSLQARGTIPSSNHVTGLLDFQAFMIATFRNGEVNIYDASGSQIFHRPPSGEHVSNTALELMVHPSTQKPLLLCGQVQGYVTAFDLPEFRPRGSFCVKERSDVKAIVDVKSDGMFATAGLHGDICIWQWGAPVGGASANPFGASTVQGAVASSPFAPGPGQGAACGGMAM
ncbi:ZFWD3 [Symbiodinium sp. CCMP2456]|nr:ZFWD3 [Symbiodinium sp. CCMP2456]